MAIFPPTSRLLIDYLSIATREGFARLTLPKTLPARQKQVSSWAPAVLATRAGAKNAKKSTPGHAWGAFYDAVKAPVWMCGV